MRVQLNSILGALVEYPNSSKKKGKRKIHMLVRPLRWYVIFWQEGTALELDLGLLFNQTKNVKWGKRGKRERGVLRFFRLLLLSSHFCTWLVSEDQQSLLPTGSIYIFLPIFSPPLSYMLTDILFIYLFIINRIIIIYPKGQGQVIHKLDQPKSSMLWGARHGFEGPDQPLLAKVLYRWSSQSPAK